MKPLPLKILGLVLTILTIATFILFFLHKISTLTFWLIMALAAIVAYWVIPKMKE